MDNNIIVSNRIANSVANLEGKGLEILVSAKDGSIITWFLNGKKITASSSNLTTEMCVAQGSVDTIPLLEVA